MDHPIILPPDPTPTESLAFVRAEVTHLLDRARRVQEHVDSCTTDTHLANALQRVVDALEYVHDEVPISDLANLARRGAA